MKSMIWELKNHDPLLKDHDFSCCLKHHEIFELLQTTVISVCQAMNAQRDDDVGDAAPFCS